ncbi:MAG: IPTL-CTERM sorting domain-containing protein [Brevundimonas sp.]|uniref:IPTL-CTERM sorting domain-containing protein n=1 Tax=Brevundimonas sp. TaxID=1871086 RepID=UPI004033E40A
MLRKAALSLAAAILVGSALPAAAQNVVLNPSFEAPVLADGTVQQNFVAGWSGTVSGANNYGILRNPSLIVAQDGSNLAFINVDPGQTKGLVQTLGAVSAGERYDASAWFGWRTDNANVANVAIQLWLGGSVVGGDISGGVLVASNAPSLVQGAWVQGTTTYTASPAQAGQVLRIRLATTSAGGAQTNFDDVRVARTAPAPVPTMTEWALILFGTIMAGGAALYIQRRRQCV